MSEREILFRGQTRRKGERVWISGEPVDSNWVYGGIFPGEGDFSIIYQTKPKIEKFTVYTDTVGAFTGLTDKNGTRIFEGDIVKVLNAFNVEVVFKKGAFGVYSSYVDYDYLDSEIAEITGCNNPSRFCRCDNFVSLWELMWNYNQEDDCCSVVEIIGNIHDNGYPF